MSRIDQELVTRSLARSRTEAGRLIEAGRVQLNGAAVAKASRKVTADDEIRLLPGPGQDYVSRAGHKLAGALDLFADVDPAGLRCLDAGASTGGFSDVLLRRGAGHVVAVDVGHGQLVDEIRHNPKVSVHEGMNVRHMSPDDIGGQVQLVVADLSFISLRLVLPALAGATCPGGTLLLMAKPQFEVGREHLGRTGVVTSPALRRRAVQDVVAGAREQGLELVGLGRSPLPGQDGNVEFFVRLLKPMAGCPQSVPDEKLWDRVDYS